MSTLHVDLTIDGLTGFDYRNSSGHPNREKHENKTRHADLDNVSFAEQEHEEKFEEVCSRDFVAHRSLSPGNCSRLPGTCQACERLQAAGAI